MSLNRWCGIGRLTRQPELRVTPNTGTQVTNFTLAVDRPPKDGQKTADFLDCVCFGKTAENLCKYMDKGKQVAVEGRLQSRVWETKDGSKRKTTEVIVDHVQFLSPRTSRDEDPDDGQNFEY